MCESSPSCCRVMLTVDQLATVKFHAASHTPKPPGLPHPTQQEALSNPSFPRTSNVIEAEQFANYPSDAPSPPPKGMSRDYSLNESDPYGGINHNPYGGRDLGEYGGTRAVGNGNEVVWQGPPDDILQGHNQRGQAHFERQEAFAGHEQNERQSAPVGLSTHDEGVVSHDYEYDQQRQLDAERAQANQAEAALASDSLPNPNEEEAVTNTSTPREDPANNLRSPWEPLNLKRDRSATPETTGLRDQSSTMRLKPISLHDANLGAPIGISSTDTDRIPQYFSSPTSIEMPPAQTFSNASLSAPTPGDGSFYTPSEGPSTTPFDGSSTTSQNDSRPAPPIASSSLGPGPVGGKISAAAFRRGAKPRTSLEADDAGPAPSSNSRRIPVPSGPIETPVSPAGARPNPARPTTSNQNQDYGFPHQQATSAENDDASFVDAREEGSPPLDRGVDNLR